jgi:alpha-glucoside transport system permease protein
MSTTPTVATTDTHEAAGGTGALSGRDTGARDGHDRRRGWLPLAALVAICVAWTVPTLGLLVTSFRNEDVVDSSGWWTVIASPLDFGQWTIENYGDVLGGGGMGNAFVNSLVVAVPATLIPIMIAAFAAYSFTFMDFKGRELFFAIIVGLLVIPLQVALVPLLQFYREVNLTGTFMAVWLAHAGFGMPLAVYILRNYMSGLPKSLIESAKIDGASHFQTFWRLVMPMSVPALAAFAIFQFLWVWNDLLIALVFLGGGENEVVTVNLSGLVGEFAADWHLLTAGAFITMVVPLLVFFSLQRFFVRGLTAGSVKG